MDTSRRERGHGHTECRLDTQQAGRLAWELSEQVGLFYTKAGEVWPLAPPLCTQQSNADIVAASVAVDLVLLAAEDHGASQDAVGQGVGLWPAGAGAGEALTYVGVVGGAIGGLATGRGFGPSGCAPTAGLLAVELQVLPALGEGQLLLAGQVGRASCWVSV